ncbi:DUF1353 domain-containing protein [Luteolibacter yonseiensis]|uniref:DUF1353 domain-containing protein n=1 Tax=Luteolibacter yonseiensis TaxID=1144680 RepID=A0A934R537_9BACT|nr:DUF1353 domain-containing protein [Luteolibacter yonseiensis]MBK1816391.1 DUF1353 domain-containing protein [Luteolibacter yonseiensis]
MLKLSPLLVPLPWLILSGCIPEGRPIPIHRTPAQSRPATGPTIAGTPDAPELKRLKNGHYRVRKPWTVRVGGRDWHVPAGYTSNGITAPVKMKSMLGDGVEHSTTWAAVFHDWLFTQPGISRTQADQLFHELLLAYGVPPHKARLMHATVSAYSLSKSLR